MRHKAFVFDAYGTLFDVHSAVGKYRDALGPVAANLSEVWRGKQLEYCWVRSLMGAYVNFEMLTAEALDYAAARCGGIAPELRQALLDAYLELDTFADVRPVLTALRSGGGRVAILSNGTPRMLAAACAASRLTPLVDALLSVEAVSTFKTDQKVYALVGRSLGVTPDQVCFVSSNRWDVAGARRFGFHCAWINRTGLPDEYPDLPAHRTLASLADLMTESD
jgi:2-haloacid dehalogenase